MEQEVRAEDAPPSALQTKLMASPHKSDTQNFCHRSIWQGALWPGQALCNESRPTPCWEVLAAETAARIILALNYFCALLAQSRPAICNPLNLSKPESNFCSRWPKSLFGRFQIKTTMLRANTLSQVSTPRTVQSAVPLLPPKPACCLRSSLRQARRLEHQKLQAQPTQQQVRDVRALPCLPTGATIPGGQSPPNP